MKKLIDKAERALVREWLAGLDKENGGRLTPEMVVLDATDPASPGHSFFTWDNEDAAHMHRLNEARSLIRSVPLKVTTENVRVKSIGYVRDPDAGEQQGYISVSKLKTKKQAALDALRYEVGRAIGFMERVRLVADELGLSDRVDEVMEEMEELRK